MCGLKHSKCSVTKPSSREGVSGKPAQASVAASCFDESLRQPDSAGMAVEAVSLVFLRIAQCALGASC